jgi:hypothetical protein
MSGEHETRAEELRTLLSWVFVGIPALWGISQVVVKSMALFR